MREKVLQSCKINRFKKSQYYKQKIENPSTMELDKLFPKPL